MVHCNHGRDQVSPVEVSGGSRILGETNRIDCRRKVVQMTALQVLVLAIIAMAGLATLRLVRVQRGREPLPERRALFLLAFLFVPPIVLGALVQSGEGQLPGAALAPLYLVIVAGLVTLMWLASTVVRRVAFGRPRSLLLIALVGNEGDPTAAQLDPPVTAKLATSMAAVDRTNAVFPRGVEFPTQIDRPGFRSAWDALDQTTATLEGQIAEAEGHGLAVASAAMATAEDARSRLNTLRRLTTDEGRAWAV
jgi:hypothetical protein